MDLFTINDKLQSYLDKAETSIDFANQYNFHSADLFDILLFDLQINIKNHIQEFKFLSFEEKIKLWLDNLKKNKKISDYSYISNYSIVITIYPIIDSKCKLNEYHLFIDIPKNNVA